MSREMEELLTQVRDAEDPSAADEERVLHGLHAAVARAASSSVIVDGSLAAPGRHRVFAKFAASKLTLSAAGAVAAVAIIAVHYRNHTRSLGAHPTAAPAAPAAPTSRDSERVSEAAESREPQPALGTDAGPQRARPRARPVGVGAPHSSKPSLRAEIELMERVQAALKRADGAAALRELDAHQTADRALLAERQAARILALCSLGRAHEAHEAALRFAEQHPDSPQREAIFNSCANSRRIEPP